MQKTFFEVLKFLNFQVFDENSSMHIHRPMPVNQIHISTPPNL